MTPDPQPPSADASEPASAPVISSALPHRGRSKSELQKLLLDQYVARDLLHSHAMIKAGEERQVQYRNLKGAGDEYQKVRVQWRDHFPPSRLYGMGYNGYGNGHTDGPAKVIYPSAKARLGHRKTGRLRVKRKDMVTQADLVEELVPIRLDVDWDKIKLRDTFTWNLHDRTVPPDLFAEQLVEDLGLALPIPNPVLDQVRQQIHEQLNDFYPYVYIEEDALDPEQPYLAYKNEEMRIVIKLNITIGPHTLEDKFEWEINNPLNSPEEFAQSMARELSLSGEFTTAIAHCIREQSQLFVRSLYTVGHPFDGRPIEDADLVAAFLPSPIPSVFRPQQQAREYAPYLYELSEANLERNEIIFSREQRRQKRSVNRRGGPTLPDLKDRQRTVRTLVVSSVLPGAAETIEDSRLYKKVGGGRGKRVTGQGFGELSGSSDSEESAPESPAMSQLLSGTARTRGIRGAATAAQQRMANLGRSETPEATILHHHETRTSARRFGGRDVRDESLEPSLMVKLKMPNKQLFSRWDRDTKTGRPSNLLQLSSSTRPTKSSSTPAPGSMGPPSTPGTQSQQLNPAAASTSTSTAAPHIQIGRIDAPPPIPGQSTPVPVCPNDKCLVAVYYNNPRGYSHTHSILTNPTQPPPPAWLTTGLAALSTQYPSDVFEGVMRYSAVNTTTELPCAAPPPGQSTENIKWMFLPRIRCCDCPGKLYTPGPETTVGNFEVHLKNRQHRERVDTRIAGGG
ncbi:hypothetical protein B7494_g7864 [Chlorociboria aeruginascens]|nr:hypothetical protein B7494_g7864 [Chlorociboria aeruginascens]